PDPKHVSSFLASRVSIDAAPLKPAITVSKQLPGQVWTFTNPFTLKTESRPKYKAVKVKKLADVPRALDRLDDYAVRLEGKGPPKVPAFQFDFEGRYDFAVFCFLRPEVVSTSDWHDEVPINRKVEFFGRPCSPKDRLGIFHNPNTGEVIEVP